MVALLKLGNFSRVLTVRRCFAILFLGAGQTDGWTAKDRHGPNVAKAVPKLRNLEKPRKSLVCSGKRYSAAILARLPKELGLPVKSANLREEQICQNN